MSNPQLNMQDDLLEGLLTDFLDESDQLLTQLNDNLLQLEEWVQSLGEGHSERCDGDLLNEMFRAAHSIKGLSAMLGLDDINTLTHKIENVFDAARNDQLTVNADVVDLVFMGLDRLTALVDALKVPGAAPVDCETVLHGIRELLRSAGAEREKTTQADAERALLPEPAAPVTPADPLAGVEDEKDPPEKYLSIFIDEAELSLDELLAALMAIEETPQESDPRPLLATAHKIKGSAASIGMNRTAKFAHLIEDLLDDLAGQGRPLSPELTDLLIECAGELQRHVASLRSTPPGEDGFAPLATRLVAFHQGEPQVPAAPTLVGVRARLDDVVAEISQALAGQDAKNIAQAAGIGVGTVRRMQNSENVKLDSLRTMASYLDDRNRPSTPEESLAVEDRAAVASTSTDAVAISNMLLGENENVYDGQVVFEDDLPMSDMKAQLIYEKLAKQGTLVHTDPTPEQLDSMESVASCRFRVVTEDAPEAVKKHIYLSGVRQITLDAVRTSRDTPSAAPAERSSPDNPLPCPEKPSVSNTEEATRSKGAVQPTERGGNGTATGNPPAGVTRAAESKSRAPETVERRAETVRVDIDRLDQLMDLAGQLVINRAQFSQIGEKLGVVLNCKQSVQTLDKVTAELNKIQNQEVRLDERHVQGELQQLKSQVRRVQGYLDPLHQEVRTLSQAREFARELTEAIHQLERVSDGIQQGVMDTRMVPVGPLFTRFKRVVRDITRANGKQVHLEIHGEKTELDKRMIDELGDPLVHMVRNSADHGIESPEVREAAGKPRQGTITLDACHRGNSIVISVRDDGKGLDADRILKKCLEKKILTQAEADKMTPQQIHQMIWEPGMSTAEKVTDVSGRGMGMDIVKSKIEDLSGSVDVESAPGVGTTITIKLPLTLAILPSLMVEIGGDVFAMPMEAVVEIVSVRDEQMSTVHGRRTAVVRDRAVSIVQLASTLRFHDDRRVTNPGEDNILVILGDPGCEIGLLVDRVVGEEDIVIKSIAENYRNIHGIAGASILGDGRVSLILDTTALIEAVSLERSALASA